LWRAPVPCEVSVRPRRLRLDSWRDGIGRRLAHPRATAWLAGDGAIAVSYGPGLRRDIAAVLRVGALIDLHTPEYLDLAGDIGDPPDGINPVISFESRRDRQSRCRQPGDTSPQLRARRQCSSTYHCSTSASGSAFDGGVTG
jgi:hypothetical protein